ncbi:hypothetical protein NY08_4494 [Rhodococcus sp. B7740]|nr:hypothetical protein NY08_4494 [Rhodococcus sp. B7740]
MATSRPGVVRTRVTPVIPQAPLPRPSGHSAGSTPADVGRERRPVDGAEQAITFTAERHHLFRTYQFRPVVWAR